MHSVSNCNRTMRRAKGTANWGQTDIFSRKKDTCQHAPGILKRRKCKNSKSENVVKTRQKLETKQRTNMISYKEYKPTWDTWGIDTSLTRKSEEKCRQKNYLKFKRKPKLWCRFVKICCRGKEDRRNGTSAQTRSRQYSQSYMEQRADMRQM